MDYSSLLNDPVRSPKGSYTPLEELLLKLKVVSEINGRDRLYHNGRILKKFDDDKDNENNNYSESMTFSDKESDGIEVKTENMTENIMENGNGGKCETENENDNKAENENENEKNNEYYGKSVNGGFKRTRSEDTYSSTSTAPILMPSSPSSSTSTSTATSTSLKDYKRLNITKAFEILKNKLSMGNNLASYAYSFFSFFLFSVLLWYAKRFENMI